ncbi:MAG: histidine--tRNA ligase [Nitrososphaeraceae archaeon]
MKFEIPRGMRDIDYEEAARINEMRDAFLDASKAFNFRLIVPSTLELLSTLEVKAGPSISNEIYTFKDKGNRDVALRFDLTVGLTRFATSRRDLKMPIKVAAFDGVWRYDEPQAGRYRYFHQWDVEIYDSFNIESDAEIIQFVSVFLKKLGLKNVVIELNDRRLLEEYIKDYLQVSDEPVISDIFRAMDKVPKKGNEAVYNEFKGKLSLPVLDKLISLSSVRGNVDTAYSHVGAGRLKSWNNLFQLNDSLRSRKVRNVVVNLGIVRGLDYYSGIVFEATDPSLKIGALVGGGRYDTLTEAFGRKDMGASGAAGGVERILVALRKDRDSVQPRMIYVAFTSNDTRAQAMDIVSDLREKGYITDYDFYGRPLRRQIEDAAARGAVLTVIVGERDSKNGRVTIRSMDDGLEFTQEIVELPRALEEKLTHH